MIGLLGGMAGLGQEYCHMCASAYCSHTARSQQQMTHQQYYNALQQLGSGSLVGSGTITVASPGTVSVSSSQITNSKIINVETKKINKKLLLIGR